ncbi:MAG: DNA methyltransferase [Dehalococcoidia bacterium]|jgi:DNA modification methylase
MSAALQIDSNKPGRILDIVNSHPGEQVLIWTQFNEEGEILSRLMPDAVHLTGKNNQATRLEALELFRQGKILTLITKPRLMGTGLNLQFLSICIFSWSKDSFEEFYQAVGRLQRYGQKGQVRIYIPFTELERPMLDNVMKKQRTFLEDSEYQEKLYIECLLDDLKAFSATPEETAMVVEMKLPDANGAAWRMKHGDCLPIMASMPENQFDLAVFSPPFADLYSYTDKYDDLGNSNSQDDEFELHFMFFAHHLYKVIKPGCIVAMHIAPLAILKSVKGYTGIRDFPAECRQVFENVGFIYEGKATIGKNPQAQAIRTHAHGLLFKTLKKDSRQNRFAIPDYLMRFKKPGEAAPIQNKEITNEEWIKLASPIWDWVDESKTLNRQTKNLSEGDTKHICPLQLDVIDACIRLWSNRGEHVLSPFAGIGSEGVMAIRHGRKFTGIELKGAYFQAAIQNLKHEENEKGRQLTMGGNANQ